MPINQITNKLIVVIFLFAGFANAGMLYFEPAGPGVYQYDQNHWLVPDWRITINIKADVPVSDFQINNLVVTGFAFGNVRPGTVNPDFSIAANPGTLRDGSVQNVWLTAILGLSSGTVAPGQILSSFTLDSYCGKNYMILDDFFGNPYGGPLKGTILNGTYFDISPTFLSVPEPLTSAIFGLGSLFVFKKNLKNKNF